MSMEIQPVSSQRAANTAPPAPAVLTPETAPQVASASTERPRMSEQSRTNMREAVERLNRQMQDSDRDLNFSVDEASDRVVITVKSTSTGEVIRQIPDQALLRVAHNIEDIKGLLYNAIT